MGQRLLEGDVVDNGDGKNTAQQEVDGLREVNRTLTRELNDALEENEQLRARVSTADAPIARLREKLGPFYKMLQAIFGDIDELDPAPSGEPANAPVTGKTAAVWDEWKTKLGGWPAKIITALLTHDNADVTQLCILIGTNRRQTVYDAIHRLNKSGLINKNGDRFTLKKLG